MGEITFNVFSFNNGCMYLKPYQGVILNYFYGSCSFMANSIIIAFVTSLNSPRYTCTYLIITLEILLATFCEVDCCRSTRRSVNITKSMCAFIIN